MKDFIVLGLLVLGSIGIDATFNHAMHTIRLFSKLKG